MSVPGGWTKIKHIYTYIVQFQPEHHYNTLYTRIAICVCATFPPNNDTKQGLSFSLPPTIQSASFSPLSSLALIHTPRHLCLRYWCLSHTLRPFPTPSLFSVCHSRERDGIPLFAGPPSFFSRGSSPPSSSFSKSAVLARTRTELGMNDGSSLLMPAFQSKGSLCVVYVACVPLSGRRN